MARKAAEASDTADELTLDLVKSLNKGQKTAYSFYDKEDPAEIKYWISTGSTLLDYAISNRRNGGIPFGRITEINGLESSGKSLLSLHIVANTQKLGGIGIVLDTEDRLLNKDFLLRVGIDPKKIVITNPGTIEGCFEQIEHVITNIRKKFSAKDKPVTIVWDSVAATPPQAEIEGNYDPNSQVGIGAKAMARGLRKLTHTIGTESIALVCVQQLRYNMKAMPFVDPYITPYGKSLAYYASTRLRITQGTKIKDSEKDIIGVLCSVKTVKNSLGPPHRTADFPIMFGHGVDDQQSWYTFLHSKDVIKKVQGVSTLITLKGEEHKFPHDNWKSWLSQGNNKEDVLDMLEEMLVKKYDSSNPANDLETVLDVTNVDSEV